MPDEQGNPVRLQVAGRHTMPHRFADLKVADYLDFTNVDSLLNCLRQNPQVMTSDSVFQIVDARGEVVVESCNIDDRVSKRK